MKSKICPIPTGHFFFVARWTRCAGIVVSALSSRLRSQICNTLCMYKSLIYAGIHIFPYTRPLRNPSTVRPNASQCGQVSVSVAVAVSESESAAATATEK